MSDDPTLYIKPQEVASALGLPLTDDEDDDHIVRATRAASRAVEGFCRNRRFWLDPEPVTRKFTARGPEVLELRPDLTELTTLVVSDETWVRDEDFELDPLNSAEDGWPYTRAVTLGSRRWPTGRGAIVIEGRWGWPQVPAEVVQATQLVAQRLVKRKDTPFGIASLPSWEGIGMRLLERFDADGSVLLYRFKLPPGIA